MALGSSKEGQQPRDFDNFASLCTLGLAPQERDVVGPQASQPSCHRQFLNDEQVLGYLEYLDKVSSSGSINKELQAVRCPCEKAQSQATPLSG